MVGLRLAWWPASSIATSDARSACGVDPGDAPQIQRTDWVGVRYVTESTFRTMADGGLVQLAVIAPERRLTAAERLFDAWREVVLP